MTTPTTGSMQIVAQGPNGAVRRYQTDGERLGEGSGGEVWLARHLPDTEAAGADEAQRVALKISHSPKWKGFLAKEAEILLAMQAREEAILATTGTTTYRPVRLRSGPGVLEVQDNYRSALIELEYLDGQTLGQWFRQTWWVGDAPQSSVIVDEVLTVARQLAEALLQIHASNVPIIHRDIKPENLMRTSMGLRLFDFNVSHEHEGGVRTQYIGTSGYMAPEVVAGGDYNTVADLYSVGVVLWEVALRRKFDEPSHTERRHGRLHLRWPIGSVKNWPIADQRAVGDLLEALVVDQEFRLPSARTLLARVEELEAARRPPPPAADAFDGLDMVEVLAELRPSALAAVVSDAVGDVSTQRRQDELGRRMRVEDPLQEWLERELVAAATGPANAPTLYVLAGNAGDGKSHLLREVVRHRLGNRTDVQRRLKVVFDATHALRPDASQADRLTAFFAPFADADPSNNNLVHVIAMNTGMVIRFFEGNARFQRLFNVLQDRLGLLPAHASDVTSPWRVEVVNLDLRDLLSESPEGGPSFVERMLSRLDPEDPASLTSLRWRDCQSCPALSLCPVAFNLRALRMPIPRRAVVHALRRVALDNEIHPSPRNLWGFMYRLATGGIERYERPKIEGSGIELDAGTQQSPCDVIRRKAASASPDNQDGAWLLAGHFTEVLFLQPDAGAPWTGLSKHDPTYCGAPDIDALHTRISVKTELDNEPKLVHDLGGENRSLAGLALDALTSKLPKDSFKGRRRDAAIRRQAFFHQATLDAWIAHDGSQEFLPLLSAYDAYSREPENLTSAQRDELSRLRELVHLVFIHGHGRELDRQTYLKVTQPNARAKSVLLVKVDTQSLGPIFGVKRIVTPDAQVRAHRGRIGLLERLGYRPNQVTLTIEGVRLTVDLALYEFLRRVSEGQRPSKRALAQFQALTFVGERIGNRLARAESASELFIWNDTNGKLHRLAADDFGHPRLQSVR